MEIMILKKRWSARRYKLWRRALTRMERDYRVYNKRYFHCRLREPTLDLDDGPARFLPWTAAGSLFVPMAMAESEPLRLVQETLLQQMGHQHIVQVQLLPEGQPEHARAFRTFCEMPHVRLALSMSYGLPGFAAVDADPEEERLYQRIARLLALSESPNRHEAEAALQEAQRLMLKHNIDLSLRADPKHQRYGVRHFGRTLQLVNQSNRLLGSLLRDHFFVKIIWAHSYDVHTDQDGNILEVFGTPANLDMAAHVYHFLNQAAVRLWQGHREEEGLPNNHGLSDFTVGMMMGFRERLEEERRRNQVAGLIWLGDKGLDDFYKAVYPTTGTLKDTRSARMGPAMRAGMAAGRGLELHRPIKDGAEKQRDRAQDEAAYRLGGE